MTLSRACPDGHRGWADRVAEVLARDVDDFAYANLAVRGKLIAQILAEQVEPALDLRPDLITISAGGNDVIRPGTDPDVTAARMEEAVSRLSSDRATIVMFTGADVGFSPVFRGIRGKVAIYNENLRAIAATYDCIVADLWSLTEIQDTRMWSAGPAASQPARAPHRRPDGSRRARRRERPRTAEAGTGAAVDLAAGARIRPRLGAGVPGAVGAPARPAPVLRRLHHRQASAGRAVHAAQETEGGVSRTGGASFQPSVRRVEVVLEDERHDDALAVVRRRSPSPHRCRPSPNSRADAVGRHRDRRHPARRARSPPRLRRCRPSRPTGSCSCRTGRPSATSWTSEKPLVALAIRAVTAAFS